MRDQVDGFERWLYFMLLLFATTFNSCNLSREICRVEKRLEKAGVISPAQPSEVK